MKPRILHLLAASLCLATAHAQLTSGTPTAYPYDPGSTLPNTIARYNTETAENRTPPRLPGMAMGDSWSVSLENGLSQFIGQVGYGHLANAGLSGTGTFASLDYPRSFGAHWTLTTGQTAIAGGTNGTWCKRAIIFYERSDESGSFRVEEKIGSGSYADLSTAQATAFNPVNCATGVTTNAGSLVTGTTYVIKTAGNTTWTSVGAANNDAGTAFVATGPGSGTGVASPHRVGVLDIDFLTVSTGARNLRITAISGPVRILGVFFTRHFEGQSLNSGGLEWMDCSQGGNHVSGQAMASQDLYNAFHGTLQPSIITFKNDDDAASMATLSTIQTKVSEAMKYDGTVLRLPVAAVSAGSFVNGTTYVIESVGTTNFTLIGAASNTVGLSFVASGPGSGTGKAMVGGTLTMALALDDIQVDETIVNDETMTEGLYYKIATAGTTNFAGLGALDNNVGTIFRKNGISSFGTGTVYRMTSEAATRTQTATLTAGTYGPAFAAQVVTALESVPGFTTHYSTIIQYDSVWVRAKTAGRKANMNIGVSGLAAARIPNATISKMRRAVTPDWILISSHPYRDSAVTVGIDESANTLLPADRTLKAIAESSKSLFINSRKGFPSYSAMLTPFPMLNADNYHLSSTTGAVVQERLVMREILPALGAAAQYQRSSVSTAALPGFSTNPLGYVGPGGTNRELLKLHTTYNQNVGNFKNTMSIWGLSDESVMFHYGDYARMRMANSRFAMLVAGGTDGLAFPQNGSDIRSPSGVLEAHGGNQDDPVIVASMRSGMTNDAFRVMSGSNVTAGTAGTRTAGVKANGAADFLTVKQGATTVAGLASLSPTPTAGTECYVTDSNAAHASNSGDIVAGGGSTFVPVYFDGTNWRIR